MRLFRLNISTTEIVSVGKCLTKSVKLPLTLIKQETLNIQNQKVFKLSLGD